MEKLPQLNMYEARHTISDATIEKWLSQENLSSKRTFQGFEITDSIDGRLDENVEVSLAKLFAKGQYPQHVHHNSDAYFIIVNGTATFLSGDERKKITKGGRVDVRRGTPLGFELDENELLEFISIQSPPIRNDQSGEEDFHLPDFV